MKIKNVSTNYYAGISKKDIAFKDGINVIYGNNEDGKSTIVKLISATLFQNSELHKSYDKDFIAAAFPTEKEDGEEPGAVIDGTLVLETDKGELTLTKKWNKETNKKAISELDTGTRTIDDDDKISEALKLLLGCDAGTYREMLLSPQSAAERNLENLLKKEPPKKDKKDGISAAKELLATVLAEAIAGSDDIKKLEDGINEEILKLVGTNKGWDLAKDAPRADYKTKEKALGDVVDARKEWDAAADTVKELEALEDNLAKASAYFSETEKDFDEKQKALDEFKPYVDDLKALKSNEGIKERCTEDLKKYENALKEYPKNKDAYEKAQRLASERENRALHDCYENAKNHNEQLHEIEEKLSRLSRPDDAEIRELKASESKLDALRKKLGGMNIAAKLKMLGGNSAKITSLLTGKPLEIGEEPALINEAVRIEIPGVMEMELAPAEVSPEEINKEISDIEARRAEIFGKYKLTAVEEIETLSAEYDKLSAQREEAAKDRDKALNSRDFAELESSAASLTGLRSAEEIAGDIRALCGSEDIKVFEALMKKGVDDFVRDYTGVENLQDKIDDCNKKLNEAQKAINSAENVPEKYRGISNADEYIKSLNNAVEDARKTREDALMKKTTAEANYNNLVEKNDVDDLRERLEKAEAAYNAKVDTLHRWLNIQKVFNECKNSLSEKSSPELVNKFIANLGAISGGRITADFPDDKPNFDIVSRNNRLNFPMLSDGSRETVSLAFKLAVLEHLFPDGGGVIVLDDPMNNMDEGRVTRSCELIKEAAKMHQIILLTCRSEYAKELGVNEADVIDINKCQLRNAR